LANIAIGTATFTAGGAETAAFTWLDALLGTPVVFGSVPKIIGGPSQTVTTAGQGGGIPYFNGAGAVTTTGGTLTCANPPDMTVVVVAIG
jgi:hypothetical protein